jgi:hypothetical protein
MNVDELQNLALIVLVLLLIIAVACAGWNRPGGPGQGREPDRRRPR